MSNRDDDHLQRQQQQHHDQRSSNRSMRMADNSSKTGIRNQPPSSSTATSSICATIKARKMSLSSQQEQQKASPLISFVSGGFGGTCGVLVGYPLDLVKVRIQTMSSSLVVPQQEAQHSKSNIPKGHHHLRTLFQGPTMRNPLIITANNSSRPSPVLSVFEMLQRSWIQDGGIRGLYRGVPFQLLSVTPMMALNFWSYNMGQRVVSHYFGVVVVDRQQPHLQQQQQQQQQSHEFISPWTMGFLAGGLSAGPVCLVSGPVERIKCLLQVQHLQQLQAQAHRHPPQYKGMVDCIRTLYQQGGLRSIWKGTIATILRDVPGAAAWYGSYEYFKIKLMWLEQQQQQQQQQHPDPHKATESSPACTSSWTIIMSGGLAGVCYWIVAMPMDVIKSRYQTMKASANSMSWMQVLKQTLRHEGVGALYYGFNPAILRAFPTNAATFYGMEWCKNTLTLSTPAGAYDF